jgi:hypothetical protein
VTKKLDDLRESFGDELQKISNLVQVATDLTGDFECTEVTVDLEITAEGGFRLVGSATASVGTTLSLKFERRRTMLGPL